MNISKNKIYIWIKENKWIILCFLLFFFLMCYTASNIIIINDDLPYSMYMRGSNRVSNVVQIIKNQIVDYKNINSRMITNGLGQFILIYGTRLFCIVNPIILFAGFIGIVNIIQMLYPLSKKAKCIVILLISALVLSIDQLKYLVYWVVGYTNYCLIFTVLIFYIYHYLKYGLKKNYILNLGSMLLLCIAHESIFVFFIIFILGNMIKEYIETRKISREYFGYIFILILSALFIFLSPGNQSRNSSWYPEWNKLDLFEKLSLSIPIVSKKIFQIGIHHIISLFYVSILFIRCLTNKNKKIIGLGIIVLILTFVANTVLKNGWFFFVLAIIYFLIELYLHYDSKRYNYMVLCSSFYAIAFSMILTPEYSAGRPNYFLYLYFILVGILLIYDLIPKNWYRYVTLIIIVFAGFYYGREVTMFHYIGTVTEARYQAIRDYKKGKTKQILYPSQKKYTWAVTEANSPSSKDYWAYKHFCNYYNLDQDTPLKLINK